MYLKRNISKKMRINLLKLANILYEGRDESHGFYHVLQVRKN